MKSNQMEDSKKNPKGKKLSKDTILFSSPGNSKLEFFTVSKNYEDILLYVEWAKKVKE